jgi:hypothetical protein
MNILHLALVFSTRRHKLLTFNENQPRGSGRRDQEVKVKQPELQKWAHPVSAKQYLHDVLCGCYTSTTF